MITPVSDGPSLDDVVDYIEKLSEIVGLLISGSPSTASSPFLETLTGQRIAPTKKHALLS